MAALTVLAALGGGLVGKVTAAKLHGLALAANAPEPKPAAPAKRADDIEFHELSPIIANLASPAEARVRLQVAIIYPKNSVEAPNVLFAQIADDLVAYVKTLTLTELQGATGLQALREDINDRAKTRSDGKIRDVMIENLVVQ